MKEDLEENLRNIKYLKQQTTKLEEDFFELQSTVVGHLREFREELEEVTENIYKLYKKIREIENK